MRVRFNYEGNLEVAEVSLIERGPEADTIRLNFADEGLYDIIVQGIDDEEYTKIINESYETGKVDLTQYQTTAYEEPQYE